MNGETQRFKEWSQRNKRWMEFYWTGRGPGLDGYFKWKLEMMLVAWASSLAGNQEVSSSVPSYLDHLTKYRSLHTWRRLSNLESRISEILYSGSPSISTGGGGGWIRLGMEFGVLGSSMETWKTGWIAHMESGSWRVNNKGLLWMTHPTPFLSPFFPLYFA